MSGRREPNPVSSSCQNAMSVSPSCQHSQTWRPPVSAGKSIRPLLDVAQRDPERVDPGDGGRHLVDDPLHPQADPLGLLAVVLGRPATRLVVGALTLAWQMARPLDPRLGPLLVAAMLFELLSSFMDSVLVQSLDEKLAHRVIGFVAGCLFLGGAIAGVFFLTRGWGGSGVWIVLLLLVPRFVTFVLDPPRQELERMRVKALAHDRLESVFVMIGLVPILLSSGVRGGGRGHRAEANFRPAYAVPGVLLASWFGLRAAAAWACEFAGVRAPAAAPVEQGALAVDRILVRQGQRAGGCAVGA